MSNTSSSVVKALSTKDAAKYIGASYSVLKQSRTTGKLWGVVPPRFTKIGTKKIIYRISSLDDFLGQFDTFETTAQSKMHDDVA